MKVSIFFKNFSFNKINNDKGKNIMIYKEKNMKGRIVMAYKSKDSEQRAEKAKEHTREMQEKYKDEIAQSIKNTIVYSKNVEKKESKIKDMDIIVDALDSVSAIGKYQKGKTAVLNFADFKSAGGLFMKGSKAQEESLCHESFLYNVLAECKSFYQWNNENKNRGLYLNRALYSPEIYFFVGEKTIPCDVITCAAPNKSAAHRYQNVSNEENTKYLKERIQFVLDIARQQEVETLILGAYGCGVFGQDGQEVASIFKSFLTKNYRCFDTVIFAIPKGRDGNLEKFQKVFI